MRRVLIPTFIFILVFMTWCFTFSVFYESWVPYYYEDYLSHIFGVVSALFVVLPLVLAQAKSKKGIRLGYYRSFTWAGLFLLVLFLVITVYMLSTSFWFGSGEGIYQILPAQG